MALAIQRDLFDSRLQQVLTDAQRATAAAQTTLDNAAVQGDGVQLQNLMVGVYGILAQQSSSDMIAAFRIGPPSANAPQNFASPPEFEAIISDELRDQVRQDPEGQWWQSVALPSEDGTVPGIVVGQQLLVPDVGGYELYLAYDLGDASQTLGFVVGTLWFVGVGLVLLISGIAWFVLRSVTAPIGEAADTSAKLAAGELKVRLEVRGEDELATLGRSFNAMADSIESQIKELADLSLVQQRFVSDVSHELRTPLTTIRLAADMINDQRDEFDPATARAAELLNAQVQRFEVLLTDLLEISRYDAGSVQLELEPTSLAHLAEDVIASMQQLADQHGTDVRLVAPGGYSPVDMDPRRVRRVVRNLLGNAIEHGEGRPIVVTVDSDQQAVALGVRDYGLGMTPAGRRARVRPVLAGRPVAHADDRRHRPRTVDRAGRCAAARRRARRLVRARSRLELRADPPAAGRPAHRARRRIPADPGDDSAAALDALGLTQPIDVLRGDAPRRDAAEAARDAVSRGGSS